MGETLNKANSLVEKYKIFVYLVFIVIMAFGFDFKTPKTQFAEIHFQIDSIRTQMDLLRLRVDAVSLLDRLRVDSVRAVTSPILQGLERFDCKVNRDIAHLAGLLCP